MELYKYFIGYARSFLTGDAATDKSIRLKLGHSLRVWRITRALCAAEQLPPEVSKTADTAALLHDYARFEQYRKYRTFRDRDSADHGVWGAELVRRHGLLRSGFTARERGAILCAIRWHNQWMLPENLTGAPRLTVEAVRDADKLDILAILLQAMGERDNADVFWGMKLDDAVTPAVKDKLLRGESPGHDELLTAMDFLCAKFAWAHELNFAYSRRLALRNGIFARLAAGLPANEFVRELLRRADQDCGGTTGSFQRV